ncbi:hypothetical protein ACM66B_000311 [Microbotryomycetes sp. NB124-2]
MTTRAQPRINVQTIWLECDAQEQLPQFVAHVTLMRDSAIVNVGAPEQGIAISQDWSCAMPPRTTATHAQPGSATSLSTNATATANNLSLGLAAKLGKSLDRGYTPRRYKQQIYLSLDLSSLARPGQTHDWAMPTIETALVKALDKVLKEHRYDATA